MQTMRTGDRGRPRCANLGRLIVELGVARVQRGEILADEGMPLNGNEMQALASRGIRPPRGAGCHEIESQAKPGFDDGEYARAGPAVRQIVAVKKNVSRLIRARLGAVIHIPELFRERRA